MRYTLSVYDFIISKEYIENSHKEGWVGYATFRGERVIGTIHDKVNHQMIIETVDEDINVFESLSEGSKKKFGDLFI